MITPPPIIKSPRKPKKTLWQRYKTSSRQQKIVLPIGILILTTLFFQLIGEVSEDIKNALATATPNPTHTITIIFTPTKFLTSTLTLTPTITQTATETSTPTNTFTPTLTYTPTITTTPTLTLPPAIGAECVPVGNERVLATVVRITDGDTIVVNIDGVEYKLRYIGVDAPDGNAVGGSHSTAQNRYMVNGKKVTLIKDVSEADKYGRLLRYVFVGNMFVNYEMARSGFASAGSWPPDNSCDLVFKRAYDIARSNKLGLWAPTITPKPYIPPVVPVPFILQPTSAQGGNCHPSYPTVCIPPAPPDLDCGQIPFDNFTVFPPDPHGFDGDHDGIGCES